MSIIQSQPDETFKITGNWDAQSQKLREKFLQLTAADLKFETGKENELIARMENKLRKNRQEVINIIKQGLETAL